MNGDVTVGATFALQTYSVSGTVMTSSGSPLVGATLNLTGAATAATTTNANGNYSFTGLSNGVYTVTAAKNNYTFSPGSISFNIYSADKTGQNFTGTVQASGSVAVSISPQGAVDAGAQWKVDTGNWQSSGATVSGLTAGAHTLSFKDVTGWNSAAAKTIYIGDGQTAYESGVYVQQTGSLVVTITPSAVISEGLASGPSVGVVAVAQWRVDGGAWRNSGEQASGLAVGDHLVDYLDISGWNKPPSATVTIANGVY